MSRVFWRRSGLIFSFDLLLWILLIPFFFCRSPLQDNNDLVRQSAVEALHACLIDLGKCCFVLFCFVSRCGCSFDSFWIDLSGPFPSKTNTILETALFWTNLHWSSNGLKSNVAIECWEWKNESSIQEYPFYFILNRYCKLQSQVHLIFMGRFLLLVCSIRLNLMVMRIEIFILQLDSGELLNTTGKFLVPRFRAICDIILRWPACHDPY